MPPKTALPQPQPLPLRRTVGFGDRLGLATPGHVAAIRRFTFAPVFAQHSVRDTDRMRRTPEDVMETVQHALAGAAFRGAWGAELTHLRTEADMDRAVRAGYTLFSVDPSSFIENRADRLSAKQLQEAAAQAVKEGLLDGNWTTRYLLKPLELSDGVTLSFPHESLLRAAIKFAGAISHTQRLARALARLVPLERAVIELDLRGATTPTSLLEHAFVATELRRRHVPVAAIAPGWPVEFEAAIDFRGEAGVFEQALRTHAGIAAHFGGYSLSVPEASDKFSLLPALGRVCGERLRVKTCGVSYLEGLRLVCRTAPEGFREIALHARTCFEGDRGLHRISTTSADLDPLFKSAKRASLEHVFFETTAGRQLLHVTCASVLGSGLTAKGRPFREVIHEVVSAEAATYRGQLDTLFTKHLTLLNRG